jgi:hypothetical protein
MALLIARRLPDHPHATLVWRCALADATAARAQLAALGYLDVQLFPADEPPWLPASVRGLGE